MESRESYKLLLVKDNTPDARLIQEHLEIEYPGIFTINKDLNMGFELVKSGTQDYLVKGESDGNLIGRAIQIQLNVRRLKQNLNYRLFRIHSQVCQKEQYSIR